MEHTQLSQAPDHIKLAVDLIQLLEDSSIDLMTIQQALHIVLQDTQQKIDQSTQEQQ